MILNIIIVVIYILNYGYDKSGAIPLTMDGENALDIRSTYFLVFVHIVVPGYISNQIRRCAGSIISETYVITAAHCVYGIKPENVQVYIGSSCLDISGIHAVTGYDSQTKKHDIGLLRLKKFLNVSETLDEIDYFPSPRIEFSYPVGATVKVLGFGRMGDGSYAIQVANMKIVDNTECEGFTDDFDHRFCVQNESIKISKDDGGSPVIYKNTLIGIVSLTEVQNKTDRSVIVKVFDYDDIIDQTMKNFP